MAQIEEVLLLLSARDSTQGVLRNFAQGVSEMVNRSKNANDILQLQAASQEKLNNANAVAILRMQATRDATISATNAQNAIRTATDRVTLAQNQLTEATRRANTLPVNASANQYARTLLAEEAAALRVASSQDALAAATGRAAAANRAATSAAIEEQRALGAAHEKSAAAAEASALTPPNGVGKIVNGGLTYAAIAAAAFGAYSIDQSLKYNAALTDVGARTGTAPKGMSKINQAIMAYMASGKDLQSGTSLANGAYPLLSSGLNSSQASALIPLSAGVGSVSGVDTATGANAITDLADTFGAGPNSTNADFTKFANQIVAAGQKGKVPFSQLLPAITKFAGVSNVAGVSSQDALAWLDKQTLSGATAARGAVGLSAFLTSMVLKPTAYTQAAGQRMGFETGANAVKDAGGLYQYVQSLKDAGALDPAVMAKILGQKNGALGIDYLFTGGGLKGSAGSPENIAANIGGNQNALAVAQAQQLQSEQAKITATWNRFNEDAIKFGNVLNDILVPAVVTAASAILDVIDKLPDVGGELDKFFKVTGLSKVGVSTASALATLAGGIVGGAAGAPAVATYNLWNSDIAKQARNAVSKWGGSPNTLADLPAVPEAVRASRTASLLLHPGLLTSNNYNGPGSYSNVPGAAGTSAPANNPQFYVNTAIGAAQALKQSSEHTNQAQIMAADAHAAALKEHNFNNPTLANAPSEEARHQLTILIADAASNKALNNQVLAIQKSLGGAAYSDQQKKDIVAVAQNRVTGVENNRLVKSYQDMYKASEIFSASVKVNHGSVQQQELAANKQYYAAVALATMQLKTGKIDTLGYLNAVGTAQDSLTGTMNSGATQGLSSLQDKLTLAGLTGNNVSQNVAAVIAYMTSNASALGLDKTQLAIQSLQLEQQYGQIQRIPAANLIRPNLPGLNAQAPFGSSIAALTGTGSTQDQSIKLLQSQLNAANSEIVQMRQQIAYLQQIKDGIVEIAGNTKAHSPARRGNRYSHIPK